MTVPKTNLTHANPEKDTSEMDNYEKGNSEK